MEKGSVASLVAGILGCVVGVVALSRIGAVNGSLAALGDRVEKIEKSGGGKAAGAGNGSTGSGAGNAETLQEVAALKAEVEKLKAQASVPGAGGVTFEELRKAVEAVLGGMGSDTGSLRSIIDSSVSDVLAAKDKAYREANYKRWAEKAASNVNKQVTSMTERFKLTTEQNESVQKVLVELFNKQVRLQADSTDPSIVTEEMLEIRKQADQQVRQLLSQEQQTMWEKYDKTWLPGK